METPQIKLAREQAFKWHEGQMYGRFPFVFHLVNVVQALAEFSYDDEELICAGYLHDTIEDCGVVAGTIAGLWGAKTAGLVQAVTGVGNTRTERKQDMIDKLNAHRKAVPLKMADRLSNIRNCALFNTRLLQTYRREMNDYETLFRDENEAMFVAMMDCFV